MNLINLPRFRVPDTGSIAAPDAATSADVEDGAPVPRIEHAPAYTLVYNDPAHPVVGYGVGWALIARYDTKWEWGTSLAGRGAGALAPARVAQAVAVRVLAEQGVRVEGWADTSPEQPEAHPGGVAGFRARLIPPPQSEAPPNPARWGLRRAMSRQLQGH